MPLYLQHSLFDNQSKDNFSRAISHTLARIALLCILYPIIIRQIILKQCRTVILSWKRACFNSADRHHQIHVSLSLSLSLSL